LIEWDSVFVTLGLWVLIVPIEAYWILWWFNRKYGGLLRLLQGQKESWVDKIVKKVIH
jgi:hypothetical protein